MKNKKIILLIIIFNIAAAAYLISPVPTTPDLFRSAISNLPGDTVQISNVRGFFTNLTRTEVINFYKANYGGLSRIIINHPPEKAKDVFVDTMQSYYLEEFIIPFKESLYINGFEWENDVFTKAENRAQNKLIYDGKEYKSKITIRTFPTPISKRLAVLFIFQIGLFGIIYCFKVTFRKK